MAEEKRPRMNSPTTSPPRLGGRSGSWLPVTQTHRALGQSRERPRFGLAQPSGPARIVKAVPERHHAGWIVRPIASASVSSVARVS
jgi:hypothetical protein